MKVNMRFLTIFWLTLNFYSVKPVCQANAQYSDCGSSCPRNCDNYNDNSMMCPMMCVKGCFCDTGYVLDAKNNCIAISDCPAGNQIKSL